MKTVDTLSAYQIRTHYLLYVDDIDALGDDLIEGGSRTTEVHRRQLGIFLPFAG